MKCSVCKMRKMRLTKIKANLICSQCLEDHTASDDAVEAQDSKVEIKKEPEPDQSMDQLFQSVCDGSKENLDDVDLQIKDEIMISESEETCEASHQDSTTQQNIDNCDAYDESTLLNKASRGTKRSAEEVLVCPIKAHQKPCSIPNDIQPNVVLKTSGVSEESTKERMQEVEPVDDMHQPSQSSVSFPGDYVDRAKEFQILKNRKLKEQQSPKRNDSRDLIFKVKDEPQEFEADGGSQRDVDEEMLEDARDNRHEEDNLNLSEDIQIKDEITIEEAEIRSDDVYAVPKSKQPKLSCNFCDFTTISIRKFKAHRIKNHPEDRCTRCKVCHLFFTGETLYKQHIQEKHGGFEQMCQVCLKLYHSGQGKVAEHISLCLGRLLFNCNSCDVSYAKKESLWRHLDDHGIKEDCKEVSFTEIRTKERFYSCVHCEDDRIYAKDPYWKHLREFHEGHPFRCEYCKMTFKKSKTCEVHMIMCKTGTVEEAVKCPNCSKSFKNKDLLQKHMKVAHKESKYSCQYCSKGFRSPNGLYFHVQAHRNERAYHCNLCAVAFNTATSLARHSRTHHVNDGNTKKPVKINEKHKYECKVCAKTFRRVQNLEVHMELHQLNKQEKSKYSCDECIANFMSKSALEKHLKNSIAHIEVNCKDCMIVFANASKFDEHINNRTCKTFDDCQQTVDSALKEARPVDDENRPLPHAKVRRGRSQTNAQSKRTQEEDNESTKDDNSGKTYQCRFCNFSTTRDSERRRHARTKHAEVRIVRCNICLVLFKGEPQYRQHIQEKHDGFDRKCPVCLEDYKGAEQEHKNQCRGRPVFSCKLCDISFITKQSLWKHLDDHNLQDEHKHSSFNVHTIKIPFNCCVICGDERMYERVAYWRHIKDLHDGHHLQCEHCKKTFTKAFNRTSHMVSCKAAAIAVGDLNCPDCQKNFSDEESMKLHKKLVHNTPKFHCQYCPRKFHYKSGFQRHQMYHTNNRKFTCSLCSLECHTQAGLASHIRTNHKCDEENGINIVLH